MQIRTIVTKELQLSLSLSLSLSVSVWIFFSLYTLTKMKLARLSFGLKCKSTDNKFTTRCCIMTLKHIMNKYTFSGMVPMILAPCMN